MAAPACHISLEASPRLPPPIQSYNRRGRLTECPLCRLSRTGTFQITAKLCELGGVPKMTLPRRHTPSMSHRTVSDHPTVIGVTPGCPRVDLERLKTHLLQCSILEALFFSHFMAVTVLPAIPRQRLSGELLVFRGSS